MTGAALLLFAGALALNAGTPGPSIVALVAQVLTRGPRAVLPFLAAMWIGEAAWLAAAIAGLSLLAERMHEAFAALRWAGILYLVWLAVKTWRTPLSGEAPTTGEAAVGGGDAGQQNAGLRLFLTGMALTLGNPKIMVFYLALLPSLVDLSTIGVIEWLELTAVQIAVMASLDLAWAGLAARARGMFDKPAALVRIRRGSAVAMGGAAAVMAARG